VQRTVESEPVEDVRPRFDAYCAERARALAAYRAGRSTRLDLGRLDDEYADVLASEALERARKDAQAAPFESGRRGAERLALGLAAAGVAARTRAALQELLEREAAQRARVGAAERPVFGLELARGADTDASARAELDAALEGASAELDPLREELFARRAEARAELGFASARAWAEAEQPGVDPDAWLAHADRVLEATESRYRDLLAQELGRLGVAPGSARRGDFERALRLVRYEPFFDPDRVRAALERTTEGLRFRLQDLPGVRLDVVARERKHPAPECAGVRVPGELDVRLAPRGGIADLDALLFLAGRASALAFVSESMPVEGRRVFDPALGELWGALLRDRLHDPAWIEESPAASRAAELARDAPLRALASLRVLAARVRFEHALAALAPGASPRPFRELYAEELSRATGCNFGSSGWLDRVEPPFRAAAELRGRALAARFAEHLRTRFERRFWRSRRCGDLLRELQETGGTYGACELAAELGLGPASPDSLLAEPGW
jgi:hypothetical protein